MRVYGVKRLAEKLNCPNSTINTLLKKHPSFPHNKISDVIYEFDVGACTQWLKKNHHPLIYKGLLDSKGAMNINNFAKELGVSRQLVQYWINEGGLKSQKLLDNSVIIIVETAQQWFVKQNHPNTRAYADRLPMKDN
jgi:uncharacterized protein YjcR